MDWWSMLRLLYINIVSGQTMYYRGDAGKISDKFGDDYEIMRLICIIGCD